MTKDQHKKIKITTKDDETSYLEDSKKIIDDVCDDEEAKVSFIKYCRFLDDIIEGDFEIIIENMNITIKSKRHEEIIENHFI